TKSIENLTYSAQTSHKTKPRMNTDEHRAAKPQPKKSHHEDTKTRRNPFCKKTKHFRAFSWERTHLACSGNNRETVSTLEACAPRDDLRVLRVSAVRFGVQALACYGPRAA